jgi:hypothetical protein
MMTVAVLLNDVQSMGKPKSAISDKNCLQQTNSCRFFSVFEWNVVIFSDLMRSLPEYTYEHTCVLVHLEAYL